MDGWLLGSRLSRYLRSQILWRCYKSPLDETINWSPPVCMGMQKDHICMLKILWSVSEFGGLWKHQNNTACTRSVSSVDCGNIKITQRALEVSEPSECWSWTLQKKNGEEGTTDTALAPRSHSRRKALGLREDLLQTTKVISTINLDVWRGGPAADNQVHDDLLQTTKVINTINLDVRGGPAADNQGHQYHQPRCLRRTCCRQLRSSVP